MFRHIKDLLGKTPVKDNGGGVSRENFQTMMPLKGEREEVLRRKSLKGTWVAWLAE